MLLCRGNRAADLPSRSSSKRISDCDDPSARFLVHRHQHGPVVRLEPVGIADTIITPRTGGHGCASSFPVTRRAHPAGHPSYGENILLFLEERKPDVEQTRRSRTIEIPAIMRALHQAIDGDPKILLDPIAPRLIDADEDQAWLAPLLDHPFAKQWRAGFALRARYAEDALAEAVQRGVGQYVILGAGLDTFAYRQPTWASELTIYEVDHPVTQLLKKDRLNAADIAIPANLRFVPIDFERTSVAEAIRGSGFSFGIPTVCSWMGVTQYLTKDALEATFRFVLSLPPPTEIVFSFILTAIYQAGIRIPACRLARPAYCSHACSTARISGTPSTDRGSWSTGTARLISCRKKRCQA